jgi:DNA primase
MGTWIDFKQLREQLDFAAVLKHYGIELKANAAGQHHGRCPLPTHPRESTSLSFSANIRKKIWRCFGCNAGGNVLDLAILLEGGNPKSPADVRRVAILLQERFGAGGRPTGPTSRKSSSTPLKGGQHELGEGKRGEGRKSHEVINAPLDFALKNLSPDHAYFRKRRFLPETIQHFGAGYCTKGMFAGRVTIPLHNADGQLIGYAGKLTDEFEVTQEQPEYLWPIAREHNGVNHVFDRSKVLYHSHTIEKETPDLIVVQDAESAWWVWQAGFPYVVALMAVTPSPAQSAQIVDLVRKTGRVWILTNGNKTGDACAHDLFEDVGSKRFCRWLRLSNGLPTDYTQEDLAAMVEWKVR